MPNSTYTYSIHSDSNTTQNIQNLQNDIIANIAVTLVQIDTIGDSVNIVFNAGLSTIQQTTLNGLVLARDNVTTTGNKQLVYSVNGNDVTTTTYAQVLSVVFPGTRFVQGITHVKISGYLETGGVSYTVRLYDIINSTTLAESTFTNDDHTINDLTITGTFPINPSILELQCKVSGSTTAIVRSLVIYYE